MVSLTSLHMRSSGDVFSPNRALNFAWLGIFSSTIVPNSAATGIRTPVSQYGRVAPEWNLLEALPTELHGRSYSSKYFKK